MMAEDLESLIDLAGVRQFSIRSPNGRRDQTTGRLQGSYSQHQEACTRTHAVAAAVAALGTSGTQHEEDDKVEAARELCLLLALSAPGRSALNAAGAWLAVLRSMLIPALQRQLSDGARQAAAGGRQGCDSEPGASAGAVAESGPAAKRMRAASPTSDPCPVSGQPTAEAATPCGGHAGVRGFMQQLPNLGPPLALLASLLYDESGPTLGQILEALDRQQPGEQQGDNSSSFSRVLGLVQRAWQHARAHSLSTAVPSRQQPPQQQPHQQQQLPVQVLRDLAALLCRLAVEPTAPTPGPADGALPDPRPDGTTTESSSRWGAPSPAQAAATGHGDRGCSALQAVLSLYSRSHSCVADSSTPSPPDQDPRHSTSLLRGHWEATPLHLKAHANSKAAEPLTQLLQPDPTAVTSNLLHSCCHCPLPRHDASDVLEALREARAGGCLGEALPLSGLDLAMVKEGRSLAAAEGGGVGVPDWQRCLQEGGTLVLRALGSRWPGGSTRLQRALRQALGLRAAGNLYVTPEGQQGLSAHYDDHCVFVLQLQGTKAWALQPPAPTHVLPLSYLPRENVVSLTDGPHVQRVVMERGDLLYLPRGWAHQAVALGPPPGPSSRPAPAGGRSEAASQGLSPGSTFSVHVTVGIEVDEDFSVAALLHVAAAMHALRLMPSARPTGAADPEPSVADGGAERLAIQAVLHCCISTASQRCSALRKACPLLAGEEARRALLQNLLQALHETNAAGTTAYEQLPLECDPSRQEVDGVEAGPAPGCCLLHRCWASLLDQACAGCSLEEAVGQVAAAAWEPVLGGAQEGPMEEGKDEEEPGALRWCHEALAWRGWCEPSGPAGLSLSTAECEGDEVLCEACAMLAPEQGTGKMPADICGFLARAVECMRGKDACTEAVEVWRRVVQARVSCADAWERAMLALHGS